MNDTGALRGIRILDLTRVLAGPYSTMIMADLGAEVIKIEIPGKGDDTRQFGPFIGKESSYFMNLNRNKKGLTLNLKSETGKKIFLEMVKKSDVVIENFRPGTMEKLGIGYEKLKEVNSGIVYGCISGFGHYGRYKERAGYDIIAQAMGGLMSTTGWPGGEPTRTGTAMGDVLAGLSLTIGVLAAINSKRNTGKGQKVDISLVDSVVSSLEIINQIYLVEGRNPERIGNRYESVYPYDSFEAKDGSLVIGCGNDKLWGKLCRVMELPELIEDERYDKNPKRVKNNEDVKYIVEKWTKCRSIDENVELLLENGIPAAPINNIERVVKDPHISVDREMFVDIVHPIVGKMKITGQHIKLSDTKPEIKKPSPLLGQHNYEVLKEVLGLNDEAILDLEKNKII
ncbi:CaiB/BaiF CoA-transferase family protein [Clostridium sediminicola]|uniref:CaiB/BaiF CoA transferase family protein n=1 Tax=Clostridium sediminicola TaxID=3114879 RepID=UPI0031F1D1DA